MIEAVQRRYQALLTFNLRVLIGRGMLSAIIVVETVIAYAHPMP